MNQQNIVIDNETQRVYVNGRVWEKSPESYMHLGKGRTPFVPKLETCPIVVAPNHIALYNVVQSMATQERRPVWKCA